MKNSFYKSIKVPAILMTFFVLMFSGCKHRESLYDEINMSSKEPIAVLKTEKAEEFAVEPPPFSDGAFPCTDCHANIKPNPVRRVLVDWHD